MAYAAEPAGGQHQSITSGMSLENVVPELWSDMIMDYLQNKLVFKNLLQDYSELVSGKGDVIHIPKLAAGGGAEQADLGNAGDNSGDTAIAAIKYDHTSEGEATITIDQHWYAAKMVTDVGKVQALPSLMEKYTMALAYDLANKIDGYVEDQLVAGVTTNTTTGAATIYDDLHVIASYNEMFEEVRAKNVDPIADGCVFVCNYKVYQSLLNPASTVGAYVSNSSVVAGAQNMISGNVPTLWGVPIVMSNQLETGISKSCAVLLHPQSFGFAASQAPRVQAAYDIDYLSTKVVADSLFGVGAINEEYSARLINGAAS